MRHVFVSVVVVLAAVLAFSSGTVAQTTGESGADSHAKAQAFDSHDLSGVWQCNGCAGGQSGITPYGVGHPPLTVWGQAQFDANKPSFGPRAVPPGVGNDPLGNCDPIGFPRNMFSPSRPVQFIQLPNQLVQIFQYRGVWRTIWTDGRALPRHPDPTWYGYSVGKWEGDTFVANTVGLNEKTWLDHFGYPHSGDMSVEERYRRVNHDTLELVLTVNDPKTYTKPWVSDKKTFKLPPKQELAEEYCVPSVEEFYNNFMRDPAAGKNFTNQPLGPLPKQ